MKKIITLIVLLSSFSAVAGIDGFYQVSDSVYRSARPEFSSDFARVKKLGIKTIINLQGRDITDKKLGWAAALTQVGESSEWLQFEKKKVTSLGLKYIHLPFNSLGDLEPMDVRNIRSAVKLLADKSLHPILVHCEHGRDRTGLVIALHRVFYQNWTPEEAYYEMLELGHAKGVVITRHLSGFFFEETMGID